jgi:hypothetical protein
MLRNVVRVAMTMGEMAGTVQFNHHPSIINNAQRFNEKERRCPRTTSVWFGQVRHNSR